MKIRNGFVSNSSSSSFIILLDKMTNEQKIIIYNHIDIAANIDKKLISEGKVPVYEYYDEWILKEDDFSLWCYTAMDNFNLIGFICKEVKLPRKSIILFGEGYWYELYMDPKYIKMKTDYLRSKKLNKIIDKL